MLFLRWNLWYLIPNINLTHIIIHINRFNIFLLYLYIFYLFIFIYLLLDNIRTHNNLLVYLLIIIYTQPYIYIMTLNNIVVFSLFLSIYYILFPFFNFYDIIFLILYIYLLYLIINLLIPNNFLIIISIM